MKTAGGPKLKPAARANMLKMSNIEHFFNCGTLHYVGGENQRAHPEADIIRALYYLWCSDRGSL
jgi:hypothetical protein